MHEISISLSRRALHTSPLRRPLFPSHPPRPPRTAKAPDAGGKASRSASGARKLHLARMEGSGFPGGAGGGAGVGVGGAEGTVAEDGLALAVADGYRPSPYFREVLDVLEDTKVGGRRGPAEGWPGVFPASLLQ